MSKLIIQGGKPLHGTIQCQGLKNAATPLIASTLLLDHPCTFSNVPRLVDVDSMIAIIGGIGGKGSFIGDHELEIDTSSVNSCAPEKKLVARLRSSVLFMGPLLARFGKVHMFEPGGCLIGSRSLSTHLDAFRQLGITIESEGDTIKLEKTRPLADEVTLSEFSVTATENCIMLCALESGRRTIFLSAVEPHIIDLVSFLNKCGAKMTWKDAHVLEIQGVSSLTPVPHRIVPDYVEAGTWAVAAAVTKGDITITHVETRDMKLVIKKLVDMGLSVRDQGSSLSVTYTKPLSAFSIQTMPHPGFPTDLQAPFSVLASQAQGESTIHDPLFEGRLGYLQELEKMGLECKVLNPHQALVNGPTRLKGTEMSAPDLRAGATIILAGLCAEGETVIDHAEIIDRGYERIEARVKDLGASLSRTE